MKENNEILKEKRIVESAVADTDNIEMTPEIEQELNKIYEEKEVRKMKKSNKKISKNTIEKRVNRYKNIKSLKLPKNKNSYGIQQTANEILIRLYDNFLLSEKTFRESISNFIGIACIYPEANLYGRDCNFSISIEEYYTDCLLLWLNDLKYHLLDLNILVNCNNNINIMTIIQCYLEAKVLCYKLRFALEQSTYDYESLDDSDEIDKYNIKYDTLECLGHIYEWICSDIDELGNYLFVYISKYETFTTDSGFSITEIDELVNYFNTTKKKHKRYINQKLDDFK